MTCWLTLFIFKLIHFLFNIMWTLDRHVFCIPLISVILQRLNHRDHLNKKRTNYILQHVKMKWLSEYTCAVCKWGQEFFCAVLLLLTSGSLWLTSGYQLSCPPMLLYLLLRTRYCCQGELSAAEKTGGERALPTRLQFAMPVVNNDRSQWWQRLITSW